MFRPPRPVMVLLLMLLLPWAAGAQEADNSVFRQGVIDEDLYVAGGMVQIDADARGDVLAAGGRVRIERSVAGDVMAAGGSVDIAARVADDVRAAGGQVLVTGAIGGDLVAGGGNVVVAPGATVANRAWLGGGEIEVHGRIGRELRAGGGKIILAGEVNGDVELMARDIEIRPTARIQGHLTYRSPNKARVAPEAVIGGVITQRDLEMKHEVSGIKRAGVGLFLTLSFIVTGVVAFLLFPGISLAVVDTLGGDPWKALGCGALALFAVPFVGMAFMVTGLGAWLGLMLMATYFLAAVAGWLVGALFLGEFARRRLPGAARRGRLPHLLALAGALLALGLLQLVPVLGALIAFILWLFGFGALWLHTYRLYKAA